MRLPSVFEHALRQRNEAMDEIALAIDILSACPAILVDDDVMRVRDRLREFYCRDWPADEECRKPVESVENLSKTGGNDG